MKVEKLVWTRIGILLGLLCVSQSGAFASEPEILALEIGGTRIAIPRPAESLEICADNPELRKNLAAGLPETNELIGCFASASNWDEYRRGARPSLSPLLVVQTYIPVKDRKMSAEEFAAITETVEAEHRRQMDRTAPKVQELLHRGDDGLAAFAGGAGDLATGEVIPLGTFGSGRDRISTAVIQKKQSASSRDGTDHLQILTTSFVLVRGKIVFLYAYREYEGPPDLRAAESLTTRWVESIVGAN